GHAVILVGEGTAAQCRCAVAGRPAVVADRGRTGAAGPGGFAERGGVGTGRPGVRTEGGRAFLGCPGKPADGRGQITAGQCVLPDRNAVIPRRARLVAAGERIPAQRLRAVSDRGADLAGSLRTRADRSGTRYCLGTDEDRIAVVVVDRRVVLVVRLAHAADRDASVAVRRAAMAHCDRVRADGVRAASVG